MRLLANTLITGLLLVAVSPAAADQLIAQGVIVAGVDLSGMTVEAGSQTLQARVGEKADQPLTIYVGSKKFKITADQIGFKFDSQLTAKRAYRNGLKRGSGKSVKLAVTYSEEKLNKAVADIASKMRRKARDAKVRILITRIMFRRERRGLRLDRKEAAKAISKAYTEQSLKRFLRLKAKQTRADLTNSKVRQQYRTILTVDRQRFKVRLFKRLKIKRTYGVALGAAGYDTPQGVFKITDRQVNPAWHVPNSDWAGSLAGQVIPGGAANNPLKAHWLGVTEGVGLHGTSEEWSIGGRASHGCIRMRVADIKKLYPLVPLGTPIRISR